MRTITPKLGLSVYQSGGRLATAARKRAGFGYEIVSNPSNSQWSGENDTHIISIFNELMFELIIVEYYICIYDS